MSDGVKFILSELRLKSDFSGCYVLLREPKPFYVGIYASGGPAASAAREGEDPS
jgi:hypothetical protein